MVYKPGIDDVTGTVQCKGYNCKIGVTSTDFRSQYYVGTWGPKVDISANPPVTPSLNPPTWPVFGLPQALTQASGAKPPSVFEFCSNRRSLGIKGLGA